MSETPLIALRSAAFGYAGRPVVSDVTFTQQPGEVIALLGPNGSGKSTLVRGILGLTEHLGGDVELFGTPLARFHDRTRIGYVPQRHSLSSSVRATVREIVSVGRLALRPWWRPASARDREAVERAVEAVGLTPRIDDEVAALSGGQQRRVLIARALSANPDVLIMDEPTAGVDADSQRVLAAVLARLAARGTSMLVVTHELAALRPAVTRIACMDVGRLDFDGLLADFESTHGGHEVGVVAHHDDADHDEPRVRLTRAPLDAREAPHG